MGSQAKDALAHHKVIAKNRTIGSSRLKLHQLPNGAASLISYSAGIQETDYSLYTDMLMDLRAATRWVNTGSLSPKVGNYRYVNDFTDALQYIKARYAATGKPVRAAIDTETLGLDPYHPLAYIVSIQITYKPGQADIVRFSTRDECLAITPALRAQLHWLLTTDAISLNGANWKYDQGWLTQLWGLPQATNYRFDTTLVGSLLDENRSNSLNMHAKLATDIGGYDDAFNQRWDKKRMDLALAGDPEGFAVYAGGDTDACLQVSEKFRDEITQDGPLSTFYVNILHPASRAYEIVEQTGWCVDVPYYEWLRDELEYEIHRLEIEACAVLGGRIVEKHRDRKTGLINITKAALLKDFMFSPMGLNLRPKMRTPKSNEPSTALDHLLMFEDDPKAKTFVKILKEYGSATKTHSTYIVGFLKHIRSDGRFHPSFFLYAGAGENWKDDEHGTVTGRLSVVDPAIQCLKGDTPVLTDQGYFSIQHIVEGYERGKTYRVLTHTGQWKDVIGVYRNGVQPVFSVMSESGRLVQSTANHPYLTQRGWVRTDELQPGDTCYELGPQDARLHQPDVLQLDGDEKSLHESDQQGLAALRRARDHGLQTMDGIRQFSRGYGREAQQGMVHRAQERERQLHPGELRVGVAETASEQSTQHSLDHVERQHTNAYRVGIRSGDKSGTVALSAFDRTVDGPSLDEAAPPDRRAFQEGRIASITAAGHCETFDLTIEGSHSFVANGIVVHNTIPKHTIWAKRLRKAIIAPPGFLIAAHDYSQGELKITACLAHEERMLAAYAKGIDLHALTASGLAGYSWEAFCTLGKSDPKQWDAIRQLGKVGNFGLIYGMGAEGFMMYAKFNYGVDMTLEDAEKYREDFLTVLYPRLPAWHDEYKNMARNTGQVRSPLGRIRHLPLIRSSDRFIASKAGRQAINSPVQSTLSDMSLWSAALMWKAGAFKAAPLFGMVHDQNLRYVPENDWQKHVTQCVDIMENLPFDVVGWKPQLRFTVDSEIGPTLGDLKKIILVGDQWQEKKKAA